MGGWVMDRWRDDVYIIHEWWVDGWMIAGWENSSFEHKVIETMSKNRGVVWIDSVPTGRPISWILETHFRNVDNVIPDLGWENLPMSTLRKYLPEWWDGKWKPNGWGMPPAFLILRWGQSCLDSAESRVDELMQDDPQYSGTCLHDRTWFCNISIIPWNIRDKFQRRRLAVYGLPMTHVTNRRDTTQ